MADALSRLDLDESIPLPDVNDPESMADAFNNDNTEYPSEHFPLHLTTIRHYQDQDTVLHRLVKNNSQYTRKTYSVNGKDLQLWVFKDDRIVIPKKLQTRVIRWYHDTLLHPGETRTEATIA